ncbi:MAG: CRTAC1 family protein [Acidobacteriota bacterium]
MNRSLLLRQLLAKGLILFTCAIAVSGQAPPRSFPAQFVDITAAAKITWVHDNAASAEKYLIETMGGGGALFDYDNDGWLDIYLVNSGQTPLYKPKQLPHNSLYRNNGDGTFTDVTAQAGVAGGKFGMGAAVGDFDNDGFADLYVTNFGGNILYRNNGDGTFSDVTTKAGVALGGWSTSAGFFDYDRDGKLDLFVCNYLDWNFEKNIFCGQNKPGYRSYCHPDHFKAVPQTLFHNNGDGSFTDVSQKAGIRAAEGKGLGVVTGDFNDDGWDDIYVANDAVRNLLFRNNGNGTFSETGLIAEVAYGLSGKPQSGMGVDMGDIDGDLRPDLFVTNIDNEPNNIWRNNGDESFTDVTVQMGLGEVALLYSGFGTRLLDLDNDGDLDIFVHNGHPLDNIHLFRDGVTYDEVPFLFENVGGKFVNMTAYAGAPLQRRYAGRALACGDIDNDGDLDMLLVNNGQPPVLLRNEGGNRNAWLGLKLVGTRTNRDAVGTRIKVVCEQGTLVRARQGGASYQAAHDPRLLIGLGARKVQYVEIRWPSGKTERIDNPTIGRYITVTER